MLRDVTYRYQRFQAVTGGCKPFRATSAQHGVSVFVRGSAAARINRPIVATLVGEVFVVLIVLDGSNESEENRKPEPTIALSFTM